MKISLLVAVSICALCVLTACGSGATGGSQTATHFSIAAPATATAGTAISLSVNALDASNNVVTRYSGTVHFASTDGQAALPANSTLTSGTGTFSVTLKTPGGQTITATDTVAGSITGTSTSIGVIALGATHFSIAAPATATAGTAISFSVNALDASNNVTVSYSGTVHFTSTDAQAAVPANSTLTNGTGTFSATLKTLGNQTITATDTTTASVTGNSSAISVVSAAPTHFSVGAQRAANPGTSLSFSVTALDTANNPATTYSGTVHFTSTDSLASLPVNSPLTNGTGNFSATLNTVGSQTITATDTITAAITGVSNSIKIAKLTITSGTPANGTVGGAYGTQQCYSSPGFLLTASGGNPGFLGKGYVWSSTSLPPGLQIGILGYVEGPGCFSPTPAAPFIFGTPNQAGTFNNVVITVHDMESPPATASATYTITINAAAAATSSADALSSSDSSTSHHHYKLIDMGTLGGPNTRISGPGFQILNNRGMFAAFANTSASNPNSNCFVPFNAPDCFIEHPTVWHNNVLTDLGVLPGGTNGQTTWISATGLIAGFSENGLIDPLTGQPEGVAVLWEGGKVTNLGTVPGGTESLGVAVNSRGQVVGFSSNDISDSFSIAGFPTQTRAFLWQKGAMRDLGTLGGPDALAGCINEIGQVVGFSYTDSNVNPVTQLPTGHAFLWQDGEMTDLGTLGGTLSGSFVGNILCGINNRGQVVGASNLAGDLVVHPFLWSKTRGLQDLGTLGGTFGHPDWINDAGEVVGYATTAGDLVGHAFLWRRGVMTDLGTIGTDPQSEGESINSNGQVVGVTFDNDGNDLHGFLWEDEGPIVNLNTLVSLGSSVTVLGALNINDRGEIAAGGVLPNGDVRAVLLIPCDENHPDVEGCDYNLVDNSATSALEAGTTAGPNTLPPANANANIRALLMNRMRRFGPRSLQPKP
jgi:probable HAF family extracellular repeat protein